MSSNMRLAPVCRYFLQGECTWGAKCRFRHEGPGVPTSTAIKGTSLIDHGATPSDEPGELTALVNDTIKVTFTTGAVPVNIEFAPLSSVLEIKEVETALQITWDRPTRCVSVKYSTRQAAERGIILFDGVVVKRFKLCFASKPSRYGKIWSTKIFDVPESIADNELRARILRDSHAISLVSEDYSYDSETIPVPEIEDILEELDGPLKFKGSKVVPTQGPLKQKVDFVSRDPVRLNNIARQVDGQPVDKLGGTKISSVERILIVLALRHEVYDRHSRELKSAAKYIRKNHEVSIRFDDMPTAAGTWAGLVKVWMKALDRKALAAAKGDLDSVLMKPLSQSLMARSSEPTTRIKPLAKENIGLKIRVDKVKIPGWHMGLSEEGLSTIEEQLLRCRPPTTKECMICWERCNQYVQLYDCLHVACRECFVQYCTIGRPLPIRCFGTDCDVLIQVAQLHAELSASDLQQLFSQSLKSHIDCRLDEFAQCPTPDCDMQFYTSSSKKPEVCPKCFISLCRNCKVEYHFGESCRAYQSRISATKESEQLEKWIKEARAKRCTRCNAVVQKLEGCDNMQCYFCKAHFCWVCMQILNTHKEVYSHLETEHGGIYADDRELAEHEDQLQLAYEEGWLAEAMRQAEREVREGRQHGQNNGMMERARQAFRRVFPHQGEDMMERLLADLPHRRDQGMELRIFRGPGGRHEPVFLQRPGRIDEALPRWRVHEQHPNVGHAQAELQRQRIQRMQIGGAADNPGDNNVAQDGGNAQAGAGGMDPALEDGDILDNIDFDEFLNPFLNPGQEWELDRLRQWNRIREMHQRRAAQQRARAAAAVAALEERVADGVDWVFDNGLEGFEWGQFRRPDPLQMFEHEARELNRVRAAEIQARAAAAMGEQAAGEHD